MLTRLFIDNFRCFVNFEYKPARRNLILGRNGSGKSSLLDALLGVRQFVITGGLAEDLFPLSQRARWLNQSQQSFEIGASLDRRSYLYQLVIEPSGEPPRPRVNSETIHLDGNPILEFKNGEVQLYNDRREHEYTYPLDTNRSALLTTSSEKTSLILPFKQWLSGMYCFRLNPFAMDLRADGENLYPNVNLSNIAAWYRHLLQNAPRENAGLLEDLRRSVEGLNFLELEFAGENVRLLVADFGQKDGKIIKLGINQLSDGQRCLICLYVILHFVLAKGRTVILDEPENFVSLPEIQPWLMAVADLVDEGKGQVLLISHHPELINQWAPGYGVQLVRDGIGAVGVEEFHGDPNSPLSPAELVARGWERG
jgi:energy-coupling factor transporter ATP-binding protein EcfA2